LRVFGYDIRRPLWFVSRLIEGEKPPPVPRAEPGPFAIASVSGLELPEDSAWRRSFPGPAEGQIPGFEKLFDATTLFYDVFRDGSRLTLIGPPLRNLAPLARRGRILLDGQPARRRLRTTNKNLVDLSRLAVTGEPRELRLEAGLALPPMTIRLTDTGAFRGRKVLFTKSRDNELTWIADWADYHARAHGADAVLIYDNASTRYTPEELLARLRAVPGIKAAVVVPWPYKFGYHGPNFDADYSEHAILEHGRRRFLAEAAGILQIDIDELVLSASGASVFDLATRSRSGAVSFTGVWIENVGVDHGPPLRHRDFRYAGETLFKTKWAAVPYRLPDGVQMTVHAFEHGFNPDKADDLCYRHFRAISTNWKYARDATVPFDPDHHRVDDAWVREMARIGWSAEPAHHAN
jgi:hypothetical protein